MLYNSVENEIIFEKHNKISGDLDLYPGKGSPYLKIKLSTMNSHTDIDFLYQTKRKKTFCIV